MSLHLPIDVALQILGLRNLGRRCLRIRDNLRRPSISPFIVFCAKMSLHKSTHIAWTFRIDLVDSVKQVNRPFKNAIPDTLSKPLCEVRRPRARMAFRKC